MTDTKTRRIRLCPVTAVNLRQQLAVLDIRNQDGVRKWMYTDHKITREEHLQWIGQLKNDRRNQVFAVIDDDDHVLGVVSANAIDRKNKKCDWAYYLAETARGGLGSAIEYCFIDYVFAELGMEKLNCEVLEGNDSVVKMHKKFLFEEEGYRKSNIVKNESRIGVYFLGLCKHDWYTGRDALHAKYQAILDRFDIQFFSPSNQ